MALNSKVPKGPIKDKWTDYKNHIDLCLNSWGNEEYDTPIRQ